MDTEENRLRYIRYMLDEMRMLARDENAQMLVYLLEMSIAECEDIMRGYRPKAIKRRDGS